MKKEDGLLWIADVVHPIIAETLREMGYQVEVDTERSPQAMPLARIEGLVLRSRFPVDQALLEQMPRLRFIARLGAGLENIDLAFAERRGIATFKAPEGNRHAVGEQALAMLLNLMQNLRRADRELRAGIWRREANRGYELRGKTVGILGYGQMGSAFAEKLQGFSCRVLAYDKYRADFDQPGLVEAVSLERLWAEADVFSIHLPQNAETIGLVDQDFLARFAKPIYLINTARGKILRTAALVEALRSGRVCGAALDVLEYESSSFEQLYAEDLPADFQFLVQSDQVLLSPHIAGWTHESNLMMAEVILAKIAQWRAGQN